MEKRTWVLLFSAMFLSESTHESILARYLAKSYQEARSYKILQDDRLSKIWQEYLARSYKYPQDLKLARSSK